MFKEHAPMVFPRAGFGNWCSALILSFGLCSWNFANGAAPALDHFYPVAVQLGTTNTLEAAGKFDPWPPKVWLDAPGIELKAETNSGKFAVEIATNAPIGPHLVRLFNEQGASKPRFLVVTRDPQAEEVEPNDDFRKPQVLDHLPVSLNGRLGKSGDVDSFSVALQPGQTLIASLEAYTLASPLDAVLRLVDSCGVQAALNHDDGRTLDPFLAWTANPPGAGIVQVFGFAFPATADVKFTGGAACVYRLHLSCGPYLHYTMPLGIQRGGRTKLQLFGWNMASAGGRDFEFDGSSLPLETTQVAVQVPGFENTLTLPVGDGPEQIEKEPNDTKTEATRLDLPSAVTGCIDKPGDEDRFAFAAKKGERLLLEIQSASLGFPLDARLKVEDPQGKELATADDSANVDPALEWTAPEEGSFVVAVGTVLHRGGPDHLYRLSLRRALPALKAVVADNAFTIEPGKTNDIKVTVKRRHGFQSRLAVSAKGLPDGVNAEPADVPDKDGDVALKLIAAADAKPFSGAIHILVTEAESGTEHRAIAELVSATVNNGVPNGFNKLVIESTDQLWLTVLSSAAPKAATDKEPSHPTPGEVSQP